MRVSAFSGVALAVALIALPAGGAVAQMGGGGMGGGRMGGGHMGGGMGWGSMSGMMTGVGADADRATHDRQGIGAGRELPPAGDDAGDQRQLTAPGGQPPSRSASPQGGMAPYTGPAGRRGTAR